MVANVVTKTMRPGFAGTQNIDGTWKHLEKHIPEQLSKAHTHETRAMWEERIRFSQWMYMLGSSDKWGAFCQAAARYETIALGDKPGQTRRPGKRKALCDTDEGQTAPDTLLVLRDLEMQKQTAIDEEDFARCQLLQEQIARVRNRMGRTAARVAAKSATALVLSGSSLPMNTEAPEPASSKDGADGPGVQPPISRSSDPEGRDETPSNQLLPEAIPVPANSLDLDRGDPDIAHDAPGASLAVLVSDVVDVVVESGGDEQVIGAELKNPPAVNWSDMLGYRDIDASQDLTSFTYRRGCVNLHMKSCHALSVLRALGANSRVQTWCEQHRQLASCDVSTCTLCQLHEDFKALSQTDVEPYTPLITQNLTQWAPAWVRPQQQCAMESFTLLLDACAQVDRNAAEKLALDDNIAARRTYPSQFIFGGLLQSRQDCTYKGCGRRSCKLDPITHMSVAYPTGPAATLERAIAQAQQPEDLLRSPCPPAEGGCGKDLRRKTLTVDTWPECLVVQLKRWRLGACGVRHIKDSRPIGFSEAMPLGGHLYHLASVICHSGIYGATIKAQSGHYWCYIKVEEQWWKCDDQRVSQCTWATVLKDQAYIFFYEV